MKLIIVESPTKAKTLTKFLGSDYVIDATMGHIKDLPKSELGIDVENNFKPNYVDVVKKQDVVKDILKDAKKAKEVYLATDPDREGEAISWHVEELLKDKDPKRITFHEITKEAVEEAIASPRGVDKHLVNAQIARRVLDRLVGYKLSPLLWRKVRRGLSAGRVQSVAVRLIVEKEREIEAFNPVEYWDIFAKVKGGEKKEEFVIYLSKIADKKAEVKNKEQADKILTDLKKSDYVVSGIGKREVVKKPYAPFTTSTMSQAGARLFGWSAKRTMSIAQSLYEQGLITYHRTDSTNIAAIALEKTRDYIKKEFGDKYLPEKAIIYKTNSKSAQEAHEAIRPTNVGTTSFTGETKYAREEGMLYDLIWKRFVSCQMTSSVYDETTIDVAAKPNYTLRAVGTIMRFDGWRKVLPVKKDTEEIVVMLPEVKEGEELKMVSVDGTQKFTEPPARFNEASLIKMLEKLGIGRPSTYAPIISTIQVRNYVEKDQGKFSPTPIGKAVNDFLMKNFPDLFEYQFTADMENDLDEVANGNDKWQESISKFWNPFTKKLDDVTKNAERVKIETEKVGRKCPDCDNGELVIRIGRFGKFISCSNFPECKHTEKYLEKIGVVCPECKKGDVILKKTSKGRKFYGCSLYPECKYASWRNPKLVKTE